MTNHPEDSGEHRIDPAQQASSDFCACCGSHLNKSEHGIAMRRAKYFRRKHFVERVLSAALLIANAPLIAFLIVLVRLTSRGPGIYRQERVGLHGEEFDVYKLRTMYIDAEADGVAKWSQKGDPRITPLGRFLRKTHLDELPQLWNVVKGEMSLTGPRPERPSICEKLAEQIDDYYRRTAVKPGVTGLAQINLEPDRTIDDVRRKQHLDLHYIETAGAWLDFRMLFATFLRCLGIRGSVVTRMMGLCRKDLLEEHGLLGDMEEGYAEGFVEVGSMKLDSTESLEVVSKK